ncbi:hypothetical protein EDD16DRAFT_1422561, partial [Pisolithus croceorrhizus]
TADKPPLAKRPHSSRSLSSTFAKYGIESRADVRHSSFPTLPPILARTASRSSRSSPLNSKSGTFKHPSTPPVHATSECRPSSTKPFLPHLCIYELSTYADQPSRIDAVAAAKCGWMNDGKDRLVCRTCKVSQVLAGRDAMTRETGKKDMHKEGCPWKTRHCDGVYHFVRRNSVYRVPLQPPSFTARDLRTTAVALDPMVSKIAIKHP